MTSPPLLDMPPVHPDDISLDASSPERVRRIKAAVTREATKLAIEALERPHNVVIAHSEGIAPGRIREALRSSYVKNLPFLAEVIAGHVVTRVVYVPAQLAQYVECANCGEYSVGAKGKLDAVEIELPSSATIKERLLALEHQAKYGLGQLREVSVDDVRGKLLATIQAIRATLPEKQAVEVLAAIEPIWT